MGAVKTDPSRYGGGIMTLKKLIEILEKYPPNMKVFTHNEKGKVVEVETAEFMSGHDEVWHEQQSEDVVLLV